VDGKVYLGGGAAGVICVDLNRATLEGKELSLEEIQATLDKKWAALQAKYEVEKKKDPDFAVPPSFDDLPKPAPVKLWEQGKEKWHVDAPVTVTGGKVLVASAFLDKEKLGDRSLFALDAKTGEIKWQTRFSLSSAAAASGMIRRSSRERRARSRRSTSTTARRSGAPTCRAECCRVSRLPTSR
jgi:outer membrane protein assembly factor BamB